jgi:ornithine cyclodeaminase
MNVPFFTNDEIHALLPIKQCIDGMAEAFSALARDQSIQPNRTAIHLPGGTVSLYTMPAFSATPSALAVKLITINHGERTIDQESHVGIVLLFDTADGSLRALLDAGALTALRTAAVSALATQLLANQDAHELAILGSGVQATSHLDALLCVRPIRRVRVWSRTPENLRSFVDHHRKRHNIAIEATISAQEAVDGADIICAVTSSPAPVIEGAWISPGAHLNLVGASTPTTREVDSDTVRRARIFVDLRAAALAEAGDVLIPMAEGLIGPEAILGELGELVLGKIQGRNSPQDITLFKSLGLAIEDAAAAALVLLNAPAGKN